MATLEYHVASFIDHMDQDGTRHVELAERVQWLLETETI
jgi:hypothetical protein